MHNQVEPLSTVPFALSLSKGFPFFPRVFNSKEEGGGFDRLSPNGFA
ncbi:MAG: hypothetical protein AVDCRST_MAG91-793 [uncultured Sphingomonadaceae bacterium]|uniref:Uncharacterized protein n=1 Tax=uncultured Sphingomonadaceae bacterium TaxID=169976 RepID=A0A6J4SCP8_9SPHN|nr:MAG: hypothetical protein AVDCRST_MAG91-793 [uncultured Sphingomonadaceae bacterium]